MRSLKPSSNNGNEGSIPIAYLVVLGFCFIIPVCFLRRRRVERMVTIQQSQIFEEYTIDLGGIERRSVSATTRNIRSEQCARIRQLLGYVKVELTVDHFASELRSLEEQSFATAVDELSQTTTVTDDDDGEDREDFSKQATVKNGKELIAGITKVGSGDSDTIPYVSSNDSSQGCSESESGVPFIKLPLPGLQGRLKRKSTEQDPFQLRLVQNYCTVCLANYEVGDSIVWSSNRLCEHAFHEECIDLWLMKTWKDPVCPCCRRDFVVDPLDTSVEGVAAMLFDTSA